MCVHFCLYVFACNMLWKTRKHNLKIVFYVKEEESVYAFFVDDKEVTKSLQDTLNTDELNTEHAINIIYQKQAIFKVRAVTRCTRYALSSSKTSKFLVFWSVCYK